MMKHSKDFTAEHLLGGMFVHVTKVTCRGDKCQIHGRPAAQDDAPFMLTTTKSAAQELGLIQ